MGAKAGVVSVFDLDTTQVPWVTWGAEGSEAPQAGLAAEVPFGLRFDESRQGIAAWATYIASCRRGNRAVPGVGEPAIVRAWIATEEVEMLYAGFATADELAELLNPSELVVQYCLRDQGVLDCVLTFVGAEHVS